MRFYLENYGCTLNQAQGEMIASSLMSQGNQMVEDIDSADSVLLSTCVVIKHTEDRMRKRLEELRRRGKEVIVSGCLTHFPLDGLRKIDFSYSYGNLAILKDGNLSMGIPIAEGCNGGCSFCISRIARGRLKSFKEEEIVTSIGRAIKSGSKEVRLTALDTGSYGKDSSSDLPLLLRKISDLEGEFKVRIGMMEPENAYSIMGDLLEVMNSDKIYKFLHIPFQSGDPFILRKMGRQYRIEKFLEAVRKFRHAFPDGMLSTDVIVGFPYETVEALKRTSAVIREIKPEILNITKYSPRPGTAAFSWKIPLTNQTSQWSQILTEMHRNISGESMKKFLGQEIEVVLLERGKNGTFIGRDLNYHPVIVQRGKIGEAKKVKIINYSSFYLIAQ